MAAPATNEPSFFYLLLLLVRPLSAAVRPGAVAIVAACIILNEITRARGANAIQLRKT